MPSLQNTMMLSLAKRFDDLSTKVGHQRERAEGASLTRAVARARTDVRKLFVDRHAALDEATGGAGREPCNGALPRCCGKLEHFERLMDKELKLDVLPDEAGGERTNSRGA